MKTIGKAAFPLTAGRPEKTASTTDFILNKNRFFRQRIKQIIVWLTMHGVISEKLAKFLISWGGLNHD